MSLDHEACADKAGRPMPVDAAREKHADPPERMGAEEALAAMQQVHLVVPFILSLETDRLLATFSMADTIGPIFEPTAWMRNSDRMQSNHEIVAILHTAQRKLRKVMEEYPRAREGVGR